MNQLTQVINYIELYGPKKRKELKVRKEIYETDKWKFLKKTLVKIYTNSCMKCRDIGKVYIDHIKPIDIKPELKFNPRNFQVLCPQCCRETHESKKDYRTKEDKRSLEESMSRNKYLRAMLYKRKTKSKEEIKEIIEKKKEKKIKEQESRELRIASKPKVILRKKHT